MALAVVAGCASGDPTGGELAPGDGVAITVAPFDLPGVGDASWRLAVTGTAGQVWTRDLTSSGYGDAAGSLSYVGPCDADANPNTVTLELLALEDASGQPIPAADFRDPGPMARDFTCVANADVEVTFDVTVARRAEQGFFDVAIAFEDVFCSAKLDCLDDHGAPLELLHVPGGGRGQTVVAALTCVAGGDAQTHLLMDGWTFACSDGTEVSHDPSEGPGNVGAATHLFQRAVFRGPTSFGAVSGCYWNQAFGLDLAAIPSDVDCTVSGRATATSDAFSGTATPDGWVWPVVSWSVPVVEDGALACSHHPVDVADSGVATTYTGPASDDFAYAWDCVGAVSSSATICTGPSGPTDCSDDGDPCTAETCLADGTCDRTFTCVTTATGAVAFESTPALDDDGQLIVSGRAVPVASNRGRTYAVRSSDLGYAWGPIPLTSGCTASGSPIAVVDDSQGLFLTYGDWNWGSSNECAKLRAKRLVDAAAVWTGADPGPHPRHDPALSDGDVYFGGYNGNAWTFDLGNGARGASMNLGTGTSNGGGLVLMSNDDMIASMTNGKTERWAPTGSRVWTSTALAPRDLYMTLGDNVVGWSAGQDALIYASGATGQQVWAAAVVPVSAGANGAVLTDAAGDIYFGDGDGATSVDASGAVRWSTSLGADTYAQLLGDDGRVYVRTAMTLYAIDTSDGAVAWHLDAISGDGFSGTWALLAGGDLFATDLDGTTYRLGTAGLDYADAPWARPRGNRRHSGKIDDYAPLPTAP